MTSHQERDTHKRRYTHVYIRASRERKGEVRGNKGVNVACKRIYIYIP